MKHNIGETVGVKEPNPMTEDLENHDFNCPWNKNNLCQN